MRKLGLYVHIPFCKSKCNYCDFYSMSSYELQDGYVDRLKEEIEYYSNQYNDKKVDTIYFGGGTPSSLNVGMLSQIFDKIDSCFSIERNCEITVEANPDTVNNEKIAEWSSFASRISVGVQSLNDKALRFAGRLHDSQRAQKAIDELVKKFSVNADVMLGLPYSGIKSSVNSVKTLISQGIEHISCYGLKIEENTPFSKESPSLFPSEDDLADEYDAVKEVCKKNGLDMYEVSNFAKVGKECKHNLRYWHREDYLGFGASAHSFCNNQRWYNPSNIREYIKSSGGEFRIIDARLSEQEQIEESIMLSLRTKKGIDVKKFNDEFKTDFFEKYSAVLKKIAPYLDINESFVSIKEQNFYAMNSIIIEFLS